MSLCCQEIDSPPSPEPFLEILRSYSFAEEERDHLEKNLHSELAEGGDNRLIYLGTIDGKPVVLGQLILKNADNDPELANGQDRAHVHNLRVHQDFLRQGWGRKMMDFIEDRALNRGLTTLTLGVDSWNKAAQKLYQSLGYDVFKTEPGRTDHEQCYLMAKDLR